MRPRALCFSLGDFVVHPKQPEWGLGQIQSIVGMNVTVNFEHVGKQMINCASNYVGSGSTIAKTAKNQKTERLNSPNFSERKQDRIALHASDIAKPGNQAVDAL